MTTPLRVLMVEDNDDDATLILRTLSQGGFDILCSVRVESEAEMVAQMRPGAWDLVLSDYHLPHFDAARALALLIEHRTETEQDIPFLVISGAIGEETAVAMMKAGAADYLLKDRLGRLVPAVSRELQEAEGRRERRRAETALRESRERLASIIESAMDAIITVDGCQRIVAFNPAAEAAFGWKTQEVIGKPADMLLPDAFPITPASQVISCALRRDGTAFPVEATVSQTTVNGAKLFTAIVRDITERKRSEEILRESEQRQRAFLHDVLLGATEGRLRLCESRTELPPFLGESDSVIPLSFQSLNRLRKVVQKKAQECGFPEERETALICAASEAGMNAVVHADQGKAWCGSRESETIQVWIEDTGAGIALDKLPRAALERGYTTAGTMGCGFWIVLQSSDRVYLLTGPEGTTVVLEIDKIAPLPPWLAPFVVLQEDGDA